MTDRPIFPVIGAIDINALNDKLVEQDQELRQYCEAAISNGTTEAYQKAMLYSQCVIHERLGNMLTMLLTNGGS